MPHKTNKINVQKENIQLFEIELTKAQLKTLSGLLPQGFSFQLVTSHKNDLSPNPCKKLFTNEGKEVKKSSKPSELNSDIIINKHALREPSKRKPSTHFEYKSPTHETSASTSSKATKVNKEAVRKCQNIIQKLKKHACAGPFLYPVDVKGLGLTDYYTIVKEPMDLSTVENKLKSGQYLSVNQFAADIRKIWNNAFMYNMKGTPVYLMTMEMNSYFEKIFQEIDSITFSDTVKDLEKKVELLTKQITELHQKGLSTVPEVPKISRSGSKNSKNYKLMEKPLTAEEKKIMSQNIKLLAPEHLRGVWEIITQRMNVPADSQEEIEFDIESLPVSVARELDRYIKNKISIVNRGKNKAKGKEPIAPKEAHAPAPLKKHNSGHDNGARIEDEVPTRHQSVIGSDGKAEYKEEQEYKGDESPSNSSESSFISASDSEDEDRFDMQRNRKESKSLQTRQDLANFFAGSHGSMLNSFIVK